MIILWVGILNEKLDYLWDFLNNVLWENDSENIEEVSFVLWGFKSDEKLWPEYIWFPYETNKIFWFADQNTDFLEFFEVNVVWKSKYN